MANHPASSTTRANPYRARPKACTATVTVSLAFDGGSGGSVKDRRDPGAVREGTGRRILVAPIGPAPICREVLIRWLDARPRRTATARTTQPGSGRPSADITVCVHSRAARTPPPVDRSHPIDPVPSPWFRTTSTAYSAQGSQVYCNLLPAGVHCVSIRPHGPEPCDPLLVNQEVRRLATRTHRRTGALATRAREFPRSAHTPRRIPLTRSRTASLRPAAFLLLSRMSGMNPTHDAALPRATPS